MSKQGRNKGERAILRSRVAHLLGAFRFELLPGHVVEPVQRVTLRPRYGMRMIMRRRSGRMNAG